MSRENATYAAMPDFERIIAGLAGQRESFEELVCQLAHRFPPATDAEYRRIHGAGGDGGVEAVWVLRDGSEHGYQAKYHTKSAKVDWGAIDKSVATALATHADLTTMYIAVATTLTGDTQRKTKTGKAPKTGWGQWTAHKAKWEADAAQAGRSVRFVPWTATEIGAMLARPEAAGLREYWFGEIELSPDWLRRNCRRTIAALEERYHPEDHVNVATRAVFDGLVRNDAFRNGLRKALFDIEEAKIGPAPAKLGKADKENLAAVVAEAEALGRTTDILKERTDAPYPYHDWKTHALVLRKINFEAMQAANKLRETLKANRKPPLGPKASKRQRDQEQAHARAQTAADYLVDALRKLQDAAGRVIEAIDGAACQGDRQRFAFLEGRAGSGKSHLIASEVERAIEAGAPALFLLGTDFGANASIENQMLARLEIDGVNFDRLLGALSAHAEAAGLRGLIAIDAINEGAGARLWRPALQAFAQRVLDHPNLALCVSCRSEYLQLLKTPAVQSISLAVEVRGFDTAEEIEQAARVYMDRRGIVRPSSPWLNPEFSNPLFLRTACLSLEREGRKHFPRGMRGTSEVLSFFLTSTGRHLGTSYDGSDTLVAPLRRTVLALAAQMAAERRDYVDRAEAHRLFDTAFAGFAPPPEKTWHELVRFRGLIREDPHPENDPSDPLLAREDVVRFSFQRFQDHLIARSLLDNVGAADGLFDPGGVLDFIFDKHGIAWQWRGLFYAAYVHVADQHGAELVDLLPGGAGRWWDEWEVQDAFVESVRWRATSAFSPRSLELLNRLQRYQRDVVALLIELAIVDDHPWNVEFLHLNLSRKTLSKLDAFWTVAVNDAHDDPGHPVSRLIDWSLNGRIGLAEDKTIALAAIALAWFCSSTSKYLRDDATKGLITLLRERPSIAEDLLERFAGCADPYVTERLYAALYGAALRLIDRKWLRPFSAAVWTHCFAAGSPPVHILTRDYARGVIDLAETSGVLDSGVDIARCRPPYGAARPVFNITEARVEARSKRVGADAILYSCYKGLADFGRYVLESRVEKFADARLDRPKPQTASETGELFFEEVCRGRPAVAAAFEALRTAHKERRFSFDRHTMRATIPAADRKRIQVAQATLLGLLSKPEAKRLRLEAEAWLKGQDHHWIISGRGIGKPIDARRAKLWVANRAIALGWTNKLFPHDRTYSEGGGGRSRIERIGKKYQRIALHELLARLTDNYWLKPDWGERARPYDNPLDISIIRDVEPTVLPADLNSSMADGIPVVPDIDYPALEMEARRAWVTESSVPSDRLRLALGTDLVSPGWVALYRYASRDIEFGERRSIVELAWQQMDFHFLSLLLMRKDERSRFITETEVNRDDFHEWLPGSFVDGPYLGELGRRPTWPRDAWTTLDTRSANPRAYSVIRATVSYQWESALDASLPNGISRQLPAPWLLAQLKLQPDPMRLGLYVDKEGVPVVCTGSRDHNIYALIRRDALDRLVSEHQLEAVWTVIGERMAVDSPTSRARGIRSRYNGTLWLDRNKVQVRSWSNLD